MRDFQEKCLCGILILAVLLAIQACSDREDPPVPEKPLKNITVKITPPSPDSIEKLKKKYSLKLDSEKLSINMASELSEDCDGTDNNGNSFIDENCFSCCPGAIKGDFDCDGRLTDYECSFPMLLAAGRTVSRTGIACADLDSDGAVTAADSIKCLQSVNNSGATDAIIRGSSNENR